MKKFCFLLSIITLVACNPKQSASNNYSNEQVVNILSDSLYKFKNYRGYICADSSYGKYLLDTSQEIKILGYHYPYHGTALVTKQNMVGKFQPIIVYSSGDDYGEYILCLLDKNGNRVSDIGIAGGWFDEPHSTNDSIGETSGNGSNCIIIDEKNIARVLTKYIFKCSTDSDGVFSVGDDIAKDSFTYKIEIKESGKISETLIDSVRIQAVPTQK